MSGIARAFAAAIVSALLTGSILLFPASAAFPGGDGKIAYVLNAQIYTVNPDGSAKRRLTVDGSNAGPRWSPDGSRIAFTRTKNLYVMNADGSGKRRVTATGRDLQPAWSRDGRQLVFIRLQSNGRGDLFRIPASGGTARRLTSDAVSTGGNDRPTWSPTQDMVLYLHYGHAGLQDAVIKTVDIATGRQRVVPAGVPNQQGDFVGAPDFAGDGQHILFLGFCTSSSALDCPPAGTHNVMRADLIGTAREDLTGNSGIESSNDALDVAAAPSGEGFVIQGCFNFNIELEPPGYDFCGIRPGNVASAHSADWQARR